MKKVLTIFLTLLICILSFSVNQERVNATGDPDYLTFTSEAEEDIDIKFFKTFDHPMFTPPTLEYSLNGGSWTTYTYGDLITLSQNQSIKFKTTEAPTMFSQGESMHVNFYSTGNVAASGNIMSLIDPNCTSTTITEQTSLSYLFYNCQYLTSAPDLPATTLYNNCYEGLFKNCSSLSEAPDLPATDLAIGCYKSMFEGCSALTEAPDLLATTLTDDCYKSMFCDCGLLEEAPELKATNLAEYCYDEMFKNCELITKAPDLPATTLKDYCYQHMFAGCEALEEAPELKATNLADGCYIGMFESCVALTEAPDLPATTLKQQCYYFMFNGCSALTVVPELKATTLADECYASMFYACYDLSVSNANTDQTSANIVLPSLDGYTDPTNYMFGGGTTCETGVDESPVQGYYKAGLKRLTSSLFTFEAPTNLYADGDSKVATVTPIPAIASKIESLTIKYFKDTEELAEAPTEVGTYVIKVDVERTSTSEYASKNNLTDPTWTFTIVEQPEPTGVQKDTGDMEYSSTNGFSTEITQGDTVTRTVHIDNAKEDDLTEIKFNGESLTKGTDYKVETGSIKIVFQSSFLSKLPVGDNKVTLKVRDKNFDVNIKVNKKAESNNTNTNTNTTSGGKDTTCEAVIGPRWHWNQKTGKCEEYSVINTSIK